MQKISGIIPASPRTKVADVSMSQPARPGAPAFGRPMGKNSLGDRITLSRMAEQIMQTGIPGEMEAPVTYRPSAEASKLKVIDDLNKKFFEKPTSIAKEGAGPHSEEALQRFESAKELKETPPAPSENPGPRES